MPVQVPTLSEFQALEARVAVLEHAPPPPPIDPPPIDPPTGGDLGDMRVVAAGQTLVINSRVDVGTLLIDGGTVTLLPGADVVIKDLPSLDADQINVGVVVQNGGELLGQGPLGAPDENTLSRPIVIRSVNPSGHRGHIMAMMGGCIDLQGVEVRDMGRTRIDRLSPTNVKGRYPVHFHLLGDHGDCCRIVNCSVHDTGGPSQFRGGVVVHGTNNAVVQNNVVRNRGGSGIWCEDGTETDNVIEGNLCVDINGTGGDWTNVPQRPLDVNSGDEAFNGSGFYLRGPRNYIRNNIARRCPIGYIYYQFFGPTRREVIRQFDDNKADQCYDGFQPTFIGGQDGEGALGRSVLRRFKSDRCIRSDVFPYDTADCTFEDFECNSQGFCPSDYRQDNFILKGGKFTNCGLTPSTICYGEFLIDGTEFVGSGMQITALRYNGRPDWIPGRLIRIRNVLAASLNLDDNMQGGSINYVRLNRVIVENWQRQGINFEAYSREQSPDYIVPLTTFDPSVSFSGHIGCPVAGLTNAQALAQHGVAMRGAISPTTNTRSDVIGFIQ